LNEKILGLKNNLKKYELKKISVGSQTALKSKNRKAIPEKLLSEKIQKRIKNVNIEFKNRLIKILENHNENNIKNFLNLFQKFSGKISNIENSIKEKQILILKELGKAFNEIKLEKESVEKFFKDTVKNKIDFFRKIYSQVEGMSIFQSSGL